MTQLIIGGITLPETKYGNYQCYPQLLGTQIDMISGRRVQEIRGTVQRISWAFDYLPDALWRQIATVLRSGQHFTVQYLPDDSSELATGEFLCESIGSPVFAFSRRGEAMWHNISFELREAAPHD